MDQTILSGLSAIFGAIIGGLVTIFATVISNRKQVSLELKKQRIEFFNLKTAKLEDILLIISTSISNTPNNHAIYCASEKIIYNLKSNHHYFINNQEMAEIINKFIEIRSEICEINSHGLGINDPKLDGYYNDLWELSQKTISIIQIVLKTTIHQLEKEITQ